jgi:serine/threonine protein kinase
MAEEVGRYEYPEEEHIELWYRCTERSCIVFLEFTDGWNEVVEVRHALRAAIEKNTNAVRVTRESSIPSANNGDKSRLNIPRDHLRFAVCEFKPYQPRFNSDFYTVEHEDLLLVKELKHNVAVVSLHGEQLVYKFMTSTCYQNSFETEVENYRKLAGAIGVPKLRAVVRKAGVIQGFLICYIEGPNLWAAIKNGNLGNEVILDITYRIIHLATELERRQFYHQDLKCSNIVRRQTDGELFFIDFDGGITPGMYRLTRLGFILSEGPAANDALFTLGRTLWELWAGDYPRQVVDGDRVENETARDIIRACEEGTVVSISDLRRRYCPKGDYIDHDTVSSSVGA